MDALIKATALVLVVAAVLAPFALEDSDAEAEMDGVAHPKILCGL